MLGRVKSFDISNPCLSHRLRPPPSMQGVCARTTFMLQASETPNHSLLVPGHKYPKTGIKGIYGKTSVRAWALIQMIPPHFRVLMAWDKYHNMPVFLPNLTYLAIESSGGRTISIIVYLRQWIGPVPSMRTYYTCSTIRIPSPRRKQKWLRRKTAHLASKYQNRESPKPSWPFIHVLNN